MDSTVSVGTLILVSLLSGVAGALLSGLFALINAGRQRKADRDAETHRFEAQMREARVERLRGDLQSLVRTSLLLDRAADAVMNPANVADINALMKEANAKYEEAIAGLVLDPDGEVLARTVTAISRDFLMLQVSLNRQLTLVQQRGVAAVDESKRVDADRQKLHDSVQSVIAQARTLITKLTGTVPTLAQPHD
jgi:hypothetical protein